MFKYRIPSFIHKLFSSYTWKVKTKDKILYLTFDDGPHPRITPWVLEQLAIYNAKATFFCVADNVRKFPETYALVKAAAHEVGNHTYHHKNGWKTPLHEYVQDVYLAQTYIQSKLFRPPYGRIKKKQAQVLQKDFKVIMWSHLSGDYDKNLNIQESISQMKKISPGSVIVFHDSEKAFDNLQKMLPVLLEYFHNQSYSMQALPQ
ncbi:MAG: polysaccharide deacetylase family protein [Bacteroidia bacterium]|nr:polysaccharide deacetylase family protein [Bacteroidia bacterium]